MNGCHNAFMNRRSFLHVAAGIASSTAVAWASDRPSHDPAQGFIDTNVNLGAWPLRRMPAVNPPELAATLRRGGVTEAWTGTLDGLLHKDLGAVNQRLTDACRESRGLFQPFGSVNPTLPGWERDLDQCAAIHRMRGIRLHPNYHGYTLSDPLFARLLAAATERHLLVQIAVLMEDERMMHPRLRVVPVDVTPLAAVIKATPGARLMLLNALGTLRGAALHRLVDTGSIGVEIATLEGVGALSSLLAELPPGRVMFGSHGPQFYFEAAALKLIESDLNAGQRRAVRFENAAQFARLPGRSGSRA